MDKKLEIKERLLRGDRKAIASITGFSYIYVKKVLNGSRENKMIWEAAEKIINSRESIKREFEASK